MSTVKNVPAIMQKIIDGTAPTRFTTEHLQGLGFASSNDRTIIPMLKELGFLTANGEPTQRYHHYRDPSQSRSVMGEAIREAYSDIFHINAKPSKNDRSAIEGKFKSTHNTSDRTAELMAMTFYAFLELADLNAAPPSSTLSRPIGSHNKHKDERIQDQIPTMPPQSPELRLRYNIEIHLPPTKDIEVYNAIFKSLKEHLLD
jgi:hypothetical protein